MVECEVADENALPNGRSGRLDRREVGVLDRLVPVHGGVVARHNDEAVVGALTRPCGILTRSRSLLRETVEPTVQKYDVADLAAAEAAANSELSMPLGEGCRIRVEGEISLTVPQETNKLSNDLAVLEARLRLEQHHDTIRLSLLRERLADPALGLVWWMDRYADLQFATGDPEVKVKSIIGAYKTIREYLSETELQVETGDRAYVRRRIDEVFDTLGDSDALAMTLEIANRIIRKIGHETFPVTPPAPEHASDHGLNDPT